MQPSSTTTTMKAIWIVEKFSRSKSPNRDSLKAGGGGFSEAASKRAALEAIEWEHRTQKQHYLELETVLSGSPDGSSRSNLQKINLSIIFDSLARSHPETPSPPHQQIPLLSLELTSFSSPSIAACTPQDQLPLKAVYKGTVLGLRYLHVPPEELSKKRYAQTEWKRVQLKFVSIEERKRFVNGIKGVCPVKLAEGATEDDQQLPSPKKSRTSKDEQSRVETSTIRTSPYDETRTSVTHHHPPLFTSSAAQSVPVPAPLVAPDSARSFTATQPLPPVVAALLPNLSSALQPSKPSAPQDRTSLELAELDKAAFEALFAKVIAEEGFEKLVERVQGHLKGD